MKALKIIAGKKAHQYIKNHGLTATDIRVIPAAAGGPKGLILLPFDKYIFGHWLPTSSQPVDLIGASIGALRLGVACLPNPISALRKFEEIYLNQQYDWPEGQKRPHASVISHQFAQYIRSMFSDELVSIFHNPRYRLHIITARWKGVWQREKPWALPLGLISAVIANGVNRKALGYLLERVVFSTTHSLPFRCEDVPTSQVDLSLNNFHLVMQASCSIPFWLEPVESIPNAPNGIYFDGGLVDYHHHLRYDVPSGIILYPHFQANVIPGWFDKPLIWRHRSRGYLDSMVILAPSDEWIQKLPNKKLPDRTDFGHFGRNISARVKIWRQAIAEAEQLAEEFAEWLQTCDPNKISVLE